MKLKLKVLFACFALITIAMFSLLVLAYSSKGGAENVLKFSITKQIATIRTADRDTKLLLNSDVCRSVKPESLDVIVTVTSFVGNIDTRRKIREAFSTNDLERVRMRRVFLLGQATESYLVNNQDFQRDLKEENEKFGDLIMGDFTESYRNLTYKHLMGLIWGLKFCQSAMYAFKQDDDIAVDYYQLSHFLDVTKKKGPVAFNESSDLPQFLRNFQGYVAKQSDFIAGKRLADMSVIRDKSSKWYVSYSEFPNDLYSDFVSGWGYLITFGAVAKIAQEAELENYFWIDDVHVTGTLRERAQVPILDFSEVFTHYFGHALCCLDVNKIKSANNTPFWCDFVVAPTNGWLTALTRLQNHARFCHTTKTCTRRPANASLKKTCVITDSTWNVLKQQQLSQTVLHRAVGQLVPVSL